MLKLDIILRWPVSMLATDPQHWRLCAERNCMDGCRLLSAVKSFTAATDRQTELSLQSAAQPGRADHTNSLLTYSSPFSEILLQMIWCLISVLPSPNCSAVSSNNNYKRHLQLLVDFYFDL